jgi:hypothetical protein
VRAPIGPSHDDLDHLVATQVRRSILVRGQVPKPGTPWLSDASNCRRRLPCRRIGLRVVLVASKPEQLVGRGDDVLDLRTGARLEDGNGVDQDRRIRNQPTGRP